jgi:hypothetical protein
MSCLIACSRAARRPRALCRLRRIARCADRNHHQVVEVSHQETLQIVVGKRLLLPRNIDVVGQQAERRSTARDSAQELVLPVGQMRRELGPGNAQHKRITRWTVCGIQGVSQGHEGGITVAEHDLAPPLGDQKRTSRVHDQADVFGRVVTPARSPVARALHSA